VSDEILNAIVRGQSRGLVSSLEESRDAALGVAGAFATGASSGAAFESQLDETEESAAGLASSLGGLADDTAEAAAGLTATQERTDELGDEASEAGREVAGLSASLATLPAAGALGGTADFGVDGPDGVPTMPDGGSVSVGTSLAAMPDTSGLDFDTGGPATLTANLDAENAIEETGRLESALDRLPDSPFDRLKPDVLSRTDDAAEEAAESTSTLTNSVLTESLDDTGDSAFSAVPGLRAFASSEDEAGDSALSAVPGLRAFSSSADEVGDESAEAATGVAALSSAMGASGFSTSFFGVRGGLLGIGALAGAALGPVLALGTALGGLVVAGGALAGVGFGALFGGLLGQAEELVGTVQRVDGELKRVEDTSEALSVVLAPFKDAAKEALAPLQQPIFQDFATDTLAGGVHLLGDAARTAEELFRALSPVGAVVSSAFWSNEPAFFAALSDSATRLAPALGDLAIWLTGAIPAGIEYMTDVTLELMPELNSLGGSLLSLIGPTTEFGMTILSVVVPAIGLLVGIIRPALQFFNALPTPIQQGVIALGLLAATALALVGPVMGIVSAGSTLVGAVSSVIGVFGSLSGILSIVAMPLSTLVAILGGPVTLILALGTAVALALSYFNLWDDAIMLVQTAFNGLVSIVETVVNLVGKFLVGAINVALKALSTLIDTANKIPGVNIATNIEPIDFDKVDLSGAKTNVDGTLGSGGGGGGGGDDEGPGTSGGGGPSGPGPGPAAPKPEPVPGSGGDTTQNVENNVTNYEPQISVDARGSDASKGEIKSYVEKALEEDAKRQRKRDGPTA